MKDYQQRVVEEKSSLDAKLDKLRTFIDSTNWHTVAPEEQDRLMKQFHIMQDYSAILAERIAHF